MNSVAVVDDHILLRESLASLINTFDGYKVLYEADNGARFVERFKVSEAPTVILLDINMPEMDGFETAAWLKKHHPEIKILALSMSDEEQTIIQMLQAGAHGYILKNTSAAELRQALDTVINKGYYLSEMLGMNVIRSFTGKSTAKAPPKFDPSIFTEKEMQFIRLSCTEMSYLEMAKEMSLSPKTIEFYKLNLEKKTGIKNRIALVLFAIRNGIVKL